MRHRSTGAFATIASLAFATSTAFARCDGAALAPAARSVTLPNVEPNRPVLADFDRDGFLDVAATSFGAAIAVVSFGLGAAGLDDDVVTVPTVAGPSRTVVGDFNRDGNDDLVVGALLDTRFTLIRSNGTGALREVTFTGVSTLSVTTADVDADGALDLVAETGSGVDVFPGIGNGAFRAPAHVELDGGTSTVVAGDVDRDGHTDLLVTQGSDGRVAVLLNDGNGRFGGQTNVPVGVGPDAIALADLDGDAKLDLVVGNLASRDLSIRLGDGDGGFGPLATIALDDQPTSLAIADFNRDDVPDVAVGYFTSASSTIHVLLGDGDGGLGAPIALHGGPHSAVAAGDVDRDGDDDLVIVASARAPATGTITGFVGVLVNRCGDPAAVATTSSTSSSTTSSTSSSTIAATSTTTTTPSTSTTVPDACLVENGPTFASIRCRLATLLDDVAGATSFDDARGQLTTLLARAAARLDESEALCGLGDASRARRRLRPVVRALRRHAAQVRALARATRIDGSVANDLLGASESLRPDVIALRRTLACPEAARQ